MTTITNTSIRTDAEGRSEAVLRLDFRLRGSKTILADQFAQAPFRIVRPFALSDGSLVLQIGSVGPGIVGGDCYRIQIDIGPGAKVVLLGTTATKVHSMAPGVSAEQRTRISVAEGGSVEYYPGLTIPYADADYTQRLDVALSGDAKCALLERWSMGRVARGEVLAFRSARSYTGVDIDGRSAYLDTLDLQPRSEGVSGTGVLEGYHHLVSGYWRWGEATESMNVDTPDVLLVSGKPAYGDLYVRGLGRSSAALGQVVSRLRKRQRAEWGLPAVPFERLSSE